MGQSRRRRFRTSALRISHDTTTVFPRSTVTQSPSPKRGASALPQLIFRFYSSKLRTCRSSDQRDSNYAAVVLRLCPNPSDYSLTSLSALHFHGVYIHWRTSNTERRNTSTSEGSTCIWSCKQFYENIFVHRNMTLYAVNNTITQHIHTTQH